MGVAILGAMAMNVASHNARMIALRHNEANKHKIFNLIVNCIYDGIFGE